MGGVGTDFVGIGEERTDRGENRDEVDEVDDGPGEGVVGIGGGISFVM